MKPIWHNPSLWEDYINGMYENRLDLEISKQCYKMFIKNCYFEMRITTIEYKYSTEVNLSKRVWNNQAWLGQATCNRLFGATMSETTTAWSMLSKQQKKYANEIADEVIKEWQDEKIR